MMKVLALVALTASSVSAACDMFDTYKKLEVHDSGKWNLTWGLDTNDDQYAQIFVEERTNAFSSHPVLEYVLTKCTNITALTSEFPSATVLTVPLAGLSMSDTVQVGFLAELDAAAFLQSYPGHNSISSPAVLKHLSDNDITDHYDSASFGANYAVLSSVAGVDAHLLNPYGWSGATAAYTGTADADKMVIIAELSEATPLGRAEWIKVVGLLLGKDALANEKFTEIRQAYAYVKNSAVFTQSNPTVWWGSWYLDTWYPLQADSYPAAFLRDAHAVPLTSTSSSLTRDAALPLAKPADFWLALSQGWGNLSAAAEADAALANFASVKADNVWENDKSVTMLYGPNDFFESAVVRPDQVLSELTRILHPSEITDPRPFKYFRKVAAEPSPPPSEPAVVITATMKLSGSVADFEAKKEQFKAAILDTINVAGAKVENLVAVAGSVIVTYDVVFLTSTGTVASNGKQVSPKALIEEAAASIGAAVTLATGVAVEEGLVVTRVAAQMQPPSPPPSPPSPPPTKDTTSGNTESNAPAAPAEEPNVLTGLTLGLTIGVIVLGALLVSLVVSLLFARTRTQLVGVKAVTSA